MKRKQTIEQVRWDLALRYRLIETVAWWEGRLTTVHMTQSFGISRQQVSKDINTYIIKHAPKNLTYDLQIKGYVPSTNSSSHCSSMTAPAPTCTCFTRTILERRTLRGWRWPTPILKYWRCLIARSRLIIKPDERLKLAQKAIIQKDFGMVDGRLQIPCRQALVKHVLQRYQIDPKNMDPKPEAQQIVVENLKKLKPWLYD